MARAAALGTGLGVLSAATFATSGPFADSLLATGWTPASAVIFRIGIAAVVLTPFALHQLRGRWHLLRASLGAVVLYGVFAIGVAQLCFFNAVTHVSVGVALLLEYSGSLLVVAWMWLRHGQRPGVLTLLGAAVAIGGLVLVLDLTGAQRVDPVGIVWGLGAATGLAVYYVLSSQVDELLPPVVMAWAGMVFAVAVLAIGAAAGVVPFATTASDVHLAGTQISWIVPVLGMSVIAAVVAYVTGIGAARLLGARVATFVGLAEVLFAILWSWLLVAQRPTGLQLVGGLVVLGGIALVRAAERDVVDPDAPSEVDVDPEPLPTSLA